MDQKDLGCLITNTAELIRQDMNERLRVLSTQVGVNITDISVDVQSVNITALSDESQKFIARVQNVDIKIDAKSL